MTSVWCNGFDSIRSLAVALAVIGSICLLPMSGAAQAVETPAAASAAEPQRAGEPAADAGDAETASMDAVQDATSSSGDQAYSYQAAGRRDPFVSLLRRGADPKVKIVRPEGIPGLEVGNVSIKGVVRSRDAFLAILEAPDNRTHIVRAGDRLFDGSVKDITPDGVVFLVDVDDPLSLVRHREVRKPLRAVEEGR